MSGFHTGNGGSASGATGAQGPTGPQGATGPGVSGGTRLTTNFYSTVTGATGPAALALKLTPSTNYIFESLLQLGGNTGGMFVGVNVPTGVQVFARFDGISTGVNAARSSIYTGAGAPTSILAPFVFNSGSASGSMFVDGTIQVGAGISGLLQMVVSMGATGGSPTGYIGTGSYLLLYPSN
jgi:hypothetical protein